jgi:hypothetical protein
MVTTRSNLGSAATVAGVGEYPCRIWRDDHGLEDTVVGSFSPIGETNPGRVEMADESRERWAAESAPHR